MSLEDFGNVIEMALDFFEEVPNAERDQEDEYRADYQYRKYRPETMFLLDFSIVTE